MKVQKMPYERILAHFMILWLEELLEKPIAIGE
jgi:hypothetical protein